MSELYFRWIVRHPWWVMAGVALATLFFGWRAAGVRFDNSIEALLPAGHPAVIRDQQVKELFGSREPVLIAVLNDAGVFNPRTLSAVEELSRAVWTLELTDAEDERRLERWRSRAGPGPEDAIDAILEGGLGVEDRGAVMNLRRAVLEEAGPEGLADLLDELILELAPVSDVLSLSEVEDIRSSEFGLRVDAPMARVPETPVALGALAARVFDNEMFVGGLVAADSSGTLVIVEPSFHYDDHLSLAHDLFDALEELAAEFEGPDEIRLAGVPMVNVYTSDYMNGDLVRLMPLALLVLLGVLYAAFRWWPGAAVPLAVVAVAITWTLGLMELTGRPVTLVVSAMPVILIAIGVADGVHLVSHYRNHLRSGEPGHGAILGTMREMAAPIVFTSLTDVAGFGSLALSDLASIRDFGLFTSFGALVALIFSLTFVPAALAVLPPPGLPTRESGFHQAHRWLERLAELVERHRRAVVVGAAAMGVLTLLSLPLIPVGGTMLGYFREDSEIYRSSEMINARFGGTEILNIVVDTRSPGGLQNPSTLTKIAALQDTLEARELVGYTTSIADYVKRIHRVMNGGDPAFARIPGSDGPDTAISARALIAQYLLLYESAGGDDLSSLTDFEYRTANIVAQIRTDRTPLLREIRNVAETFADREFGGEAEVTFAGCSNLCIVADDLIIPSQLRSLGLAVVLVFGLLVLVFRSARLGLLGLFPLLLTVLGVFALLAIFQVSLDAVTALIASIVLGVGIDYSVHFVARYRSLLRGGSPSPAAVRGAITETGPAIILNSVAVASGFLVVALSSFWPVVHIGWIVAVTMVVAAALTLTLLPATLLRPFAEGRSPIR